MATRKKAAKRSTKKTRKSSKVKHKKKTFVAEQAMKKITKASLNKLPLKNLETVKRQLKNRSSDTEILLDHRSQIDPTWKSPEYMKGFSDSPFLK